MKYNEIETHEPGELIEVEGSNTVIFSRDNPSPLYPFRCPICGRGTIGRINNLPLLRFGMCALCRMWWAEKAQTIPDATFEEKLEKYFEWIKLQREKFGYKK